MKITAKFFNSKISAEWLLTASLTISPLFLLTVANWISGILFISCALSVYIITKAVIRKSDIVPANISRNWLILLIAVLASPIVAVFLGQCFRMEFAWRYYDSPSRFLACIPILLAIVHCNINAVKLLGYSISAATFSALVSVTINPNVMFGSHRLTTHFVDPLSFGSLGLTLALFCLASINISNNESSTLKLYKFCGFGIGFYLSILSGSRTGWLAPPIAIFIWLLFRDYHRRFLNLALAIGVPFILSIAAFYHFPIVQQRVVLTANQLLAYHWNELNPDNSTSMRITFCRIALLLFAQRPFGGWGDTGFSHFMNTPDIARFASQNTRDYVLGSGFHNEIMTNIVRSGIWGMISSISIFLVPAMFFIRGLSSKLLPIRRLAILGCSYLVCTFISGMSTEVFNLKFTASFHALMITCIAGSLLLAMYSGNDSKNTSPPGSLNSLCELPLKSSSN